MIELKPSKQHLGKWNPDGLKLKSIKKSLPFLESFRGCYSQGKARNHADF